MNLHTLHRTLGLVFFVGLLTSAGSGIIHTVMTRTQSPPPKALPSGAPIDLAKVKLSPAQAVAALPPENASILALNLRTIGGQPFYILRPTGQKLTVYLDAESGQIATEADAQFAAEIARKFLAGAEVKQTDYLTAFTREYISIFRILPVYRFDAADGKGTRVYVSTMTESVTRYTDNQRQLEADIFSNFHKLAFIPQKDWRDWTLVTLTAGTLLTAIAGLALLIRRLSQKQSPAVAPPPP